MKNIATFMLVSALMLGFFTSCDSGVQHRTFRGIYADDPAAVSYTHLDVYKRQTLS